MSSKWKKILLVILAVGLLAGVFQVQQSMNRDRDRLGLTRVQPLENAPPVLAFTTVALGGFRGLISNILWIRASDLQDDDKYFEMAQLADWITKLEPHFVQVWLVQAWNMAYNISVKFKDFSDRWRWVDRGLQLLRDDGLRYNPNETLIYRELAWFFQHKMGANMDDANMYYKQEWANEMAEVFGKKTPDLEELIHPQTEDQKRRAQLLREKFKMDPEFMKQVNERYGPLEWRLPEAHSIYWAALGLEKAQLNPAKIKPEDLITLRRVIYQSMQMSFQRGRLVANPFIKSFEFGPNLDIIPKVSAAYEQAAKEDEKNRDHIEKAHKNFLKDAVYFLYVHNRLGDAAKWFQYLGTKYPTSTLLDYQTNSFARNLTLDEYAVSRVQEDVTETMSRDRVKAIIEGLLANALTSLAIGEDERAAGYKLLAEKVRTTYSEKTKMRAEALALSSLDDIQREVLNRMLDPEHGVVPEMRAVLRTKLNLGPEPPITGRCNQLSAGERFEQMKPQAERPLRVGLISLGCAKNLVDSEVMVGTLLKDGVQITNDAAEADVVIVNTCSFIDSAQEESVDTILESAEVRQARNRQQGLIVAGCLPQRFREELPKLLPEVDAFMGIDQVAQVTDIVRQTLERRAARLRETARQKVSERIPKQEKRSRPGTAKAKIVGRLAELEAKAVTSLDGNGGEAHHHDESGYPDKTGAKAHLVASDLAAAPLFSVNSRPNYIPDYATPRFRLTPRHFAYVKIAEGCNHPCSFCIIPRMRGSHRSRSQNDIMAEARALIADGVKELNLISQDSTYYGLDLRPNHSRAIAAPDRFSAAVNALPAEASTICTLVRELNSLPGDFWIRLLYTHPAHWTDDLIATIAACPKVARYIDIPLQHIHENMLERMRRETSRKYIEELLHRIRTGVPGIAIRTTFIVGFPGETENYFEALLEFIEATRFERLGVFTFSQEEGTRAGKMSGQIPLKTRQRRRDRAMAAQHKVAVAVAESFVGRTIRVLVEGEATAKDLKHARISSWEHGLIRGQDSRTARLKGRYLVARGEADAPDIDGRVYIRGDLPKGEFAQVKIVGHTDYDLIGEPA